MQSMIPRGGPADNAAGVHNQDDGPVLTQWIQPTFAGPDVADLSGPFLIGAMVGSLGEPAKYGSLAM